MPVLTSRTARATAHSFRARHPGGDAAPSLAPLLHLFLAAGGDERIATDDLHSRNRYGITLAPAMDEIWLSSSTASAITPRGYRAAGDALAALMGTDGRAPLSLPKWTDRIRARIEALVSPAAASAVLCPSGTDGELAALAVARALLPGPLTNIVVAPDETGSGVMMAAAGRHFLATSSLGGDVTKSSRLAGLEAADIETVAVEIRHADGTPRPAADIDNDAATAAASALAAGRSVLLHILDVSKTGLAGVTPATAAAIAADAPGRVLVLVDACQLRSPLVTLARRIADGFMVLISGSKYGAGPPFSGALLLPEALEHALRHAEAPAAGLALHSARLDWPASLQATFARDLGSANIGAALRWIGALAEIERVAALPAGLEAAILARFSRAVRDRACNQPLCLPLNDRDHGAETVTSIVPLIALDAAGAPVSLPQAQSLHAALRAEGPSPHRQRVHLGQPVRIGERVALRVCASAAMVADIAERLDDGTDLDTAFEPVSRALDIAFAKWAALSGNVP